MRETSATGTAVGARRILPAPRSRCGGALRDGPVRRRRSTSPRVGGVAPGAVVGFAVPPGGAVTTGVGLGVGVGAGDAVGEGVGVEVEHVPAGEAGDGSAPASGS